MSEHEGASSQERKSALQPVRLRSGVDTDTAPNPTLAAMAPHAIASLCASSVTSSVSTPDNVHRLTLESAAPSAQPNLLDELDGCQVMPSEPEPGSRHAPLPVLETIISRLQSGPCQLLVHGDPGTGKSTLLQHILEHHAQSAELQAEYPGGVALVHCGCESRLSCEHLLSLLKQLRTWSPKTLASALASDAELFRMELLLEVQLNLASGERVLLLLDDVGGSHLLEELGVGFDSACPTSVVTTSDQPLVECPSSLQMIHVNDGADYAAIAQQVFDDTVLRFHPTPLSPALKDLVQGMLRKCHGNMLMLRIIVGVLGYALKHDSAPPEVSWLYVCQLLESIETFVGVSQRERQPAVACFVAINAMNELTPDTCTVFSTLRLFAASGHVPLAAARTVWGEWQGGEAGFDEHVAVLKDMNLLDVVKEEKWGLQQTFIQQHPVLYRLLQSKKLSVEVPPSSAPARHTLSTALVALLSPVRPHDTTTALASWPTSAADTPCMWWPVAAPSMQSCRASHHLLDFIHLLDDPDLSSFARTVVMSGARGIVSPQLCTIMSSNLMKHPRAMAAALSFLVAIQPCHVALKDAWGSLVTSCLEDLGVRSEAGPKMLGFYEHCAGCMRALGKPDVALQFLSMVLQVLVDQDGGACMSVLRVRSEMADVRALLGQQLEGLKGHEQVFKQIPMKQERCSPNAVPCLLAYADMLAGYGQDDAALGLRVDALQTCQQCLWQPNVALVPLLLLLGQSLIELVKSNEAVDLLLEASELLHMQFGDVHPLVATALASVAQAFHNMGQLEDALDLYKHVLKLRYIFLSEDHPDYMSTLTAIAHTMREMGELQKALELLEHIAQCYVQQRGVELEDRGLSALDDVASTLVAMGEHAHAVELLQWISALRCKTLHEGHPDVESTRMRLAMTYADMEAYEEAMLLYKVILEARPPISEDQPAGTLAGTALVLTHLSVAQQLAGRHEEAIEGFRNLLGVRQAIFGPRHVAVASAMSSLATALEQAACSACPESSPDCPQGQDKLDEALRLRRQVVDLREDLLGGQDEDTLIAKNHLACCLGQHGLLEEAMDLHLSTQRATEAALGNTNHITIAMTRTLACALEDVGRVEEAVQWMEQTLTWQRRMVARPGCSVALTMENLAFMLIRLGKYGQALDLQEEALGVRLETAGRLHPSSAMAMNALAANLSEMGRVQPAVNMYRQALHVFRVAPWSRQELQVTPLTGMAKLWAMEGHVQDALTVQKYALDLLEKSPAYGPQHKRTEIARSNLRHLQATCQHQGGRWPGVRRASRSTQLLEELSLDSR